MEHILIYYFSGTGNTAYVTNLLQSDLVKHVKSVEIVNIEQISGPILPDSFNGIDAVGLCYPVYGFRAPAIVKRFAAFLPAQTDMPLFHIKTAGGISPVNEGASANVMHKLKRKRYQTFYDRTVVMGSNWLIAYDPRLVKQLAETAKEKTAQIALDIVNQVQRLPKVSFFALLLGSLTSAGEHGIGAKVYGISLHAKSTCNRCMVCVKNCPQHNIQDKNGKITFGVNCLWCMRCVYACKQQAIHSRLMQFSVLKDGYDLNKTLADKAIKPDFFDEHTQKSHAQFYAYCIDQNA